MDVGAAVDFPEADYIEVEQQVAGYVARLGVSAPRPEGFAGFLGGWNALTMRFRAAAEESLAARMFLVRSQGDLSAEDRYLQERALFGFFANAMSAVESCCFTIYHLGQMRQPTFFALPDDRVTVSVTSDAFALAFPGTQVDVELSALKVAPDWLNIKSIRNTLVHRESPGITIFAGAGTMPVRPAEWTGREVVLEPSLVDIPRAWLGTAVARLVGTTLDFVKTNF